MPEEPYNPSPIGNPSTLARRNWWQTILVKFIGKHTPKCREMVRILSQSMDEPKRGNVSSRSWRKALVRLNSAVRNLSPCRRMGHENGVALEGYDPVAYFTAGKPVKGSLEFPASYKAHRTKLPQWRKTV